MSVNINPFLTWLNGVFQGITKVFAAIQRALLGVKNINFCRGGRVMTWWGYMEEILLFYNIWSQKVHKFRESCLSNSMWDMWANEIINSTCRWAHYGIERVVFRA